VVDPGETDPLKFDTDDDGVNDFIEGVLGSDPNNPTITPGSLGKYYFVLPYMQDPTPLDNIVPLRTNLNQGDVAFVVDTTSSMGGEIQNLTTSLSTIIATLTNPQQAAHIPDLAIGIAGHDDFPDGIYGTSPVDKPFYVAGPTGFMSTLAADNQSAVNTLTVHDGLDNPESQIAAYDRALTDYYLQWDNGGEIPPGGAPGTTYGSLHFRKGSLPILIGITDAPFHNGRRTSDAPGVFHDKYIFDDTPPFPTPTMDVLIADMNAKGARYVGISASDGVRNGGDPYEDMATLVDNVQSFVSPKVFGGIQCLTGPSGAAIPPDGPATADDPAGTCRLIFDIGKDGTGLGQSVVNGIVALLKSIHLDVRALASPDPNDPLDAVDTFIQSIAVNPSGGADAQEPGVQCIAIDPVKQQKDNWTGPKGLLKMPDGVNETALNIVPSQKICFKILPKPNTTITQDDKPHVYKAVLTVKAQNGKSSDELVLGDPKKPREIAFIIPPAPQ
jgi:hypothetical protein